MSTATDSPTAGKLGSFGTSFWLLLLALSVLAFGANTGYATYEGGRLAGASRELAGLASQLSDRVSFFHV